MYQVTIEVPEEDFRVVVISDLHIGTKSFREDMWLEQLDELKKPNTYWISLGDIVEGRTHNDGKMYDIFNTNMTLGEQYTYFFDAVRPYADKCLGMIVGNHEHGHISKFDLNPIREFCAANKIHYLGYVGRVILKNNKGVCRLLALHGAGGGAKIGSGMNRMNDYAKSFLPDVTLMGHHHKPGMNIDTQPREDKHNMIQMYPRYNIMVGSLMDGYQEGVDTYAERFMMSPGICSYTIIHFDDDVKIKPVGVEMRFSDY